MQITFTEEALKQLRVPAGKRDYQWLDKSLPGFGFRKFTSGRAAYFVKYQLGKKQRKITLSTYAPGILAQMRRRAIELLADARRGVDSRLAERQKKLECEPTFGEMSEIYIEGRRKELSTKWHKYISVFLRQNWSVFHNRQLRSLERGELVIHLDKIAKLNGDVTADHCRVTLSALFGWAIDRGYATANPLARVKRYAKDNARDRVLSLCELVAVWKTIPSDDFGRIVGLLILTCQRRQEISELVWPEIDLDNDQQINLPKERTKNGRAHMVPLSRPALVILNELSRAGDRDFLFGEGKRGFQGWSKAKTRMDFGIRCLIDPKQMARLEALTGDLTQPANQKNADDAARSLGFASIAAFSEGIMPRWTLHDLRRTGATLMHEFGLAEPHIIEAVLNHISGASKRGVAGIYNRAEYLEQKRWALDRLGEFMMSAVAEYDRGGFSAVNSFAGREKQKVRPPS